MYIIFNIMVSKVFNPSISEDLAKLGLRIRLARLRREQTMLLVSEKAGLSRQTLMAIEKGDPGVSLGAYLSVLNALNLSQDINKIAEDDDLGKKLQDLKLETPKMRAPKRKSL